MTRKDLNKMLIEHRVDKYFTGFECADGWIDLISELHDELYDLDSDYKILEINALGGKLKAAISTRLGGVVWAKMLDVVKEYGEKSGEICEFCGGEGLSCLFGLTYKTCCKQCLVEFSQENPKTKYQFVSNGVKGK